MRYSMLETKIPLKKFKTLMDTKIPSKNWEINEGAVYGYMIETNKFVLGVKIAPRSFRNFISEELIGYIEDDGRVYYRFQRTAISVVATCIVPLFTTLICLVWGCIIAKMYETSLCLLITLPLFLCNFIRPLKSRRYLEFLLNEIVKRD